jgi:hypothetical protein
VALRSAAIALTAATARTVAGCGTRQPTSGRHTVTTAQRTGARAEAEAYARRALHELRLPAGARRTGVSALPSPMRHSSLPGVSRGSVDEYAVYKIGSPVTAVNRFLARHVPAGWRVGTTGRFAMPSVSTGYGRDDYPAKLPPWAYQITLAIQVVPARSGGSLVRVEAKVVWYPPRSTAEHIDPARYRAVTVMVPAARIATPGRTAAGSSTPGQPQRGVPGGRAPGLTKRIARTFTSARIVARLAGLVNGLRAMPDIAIFCPAMLVDRYSRLIFLPRTAAAARVVITMPGCIGMNVTVGGHMEPALDPGDGSLLAVMNRLLGVAPAG